MLSAIFKTMRPRQWTKNFFIFAALIFDRQLTHYNSLLKCIAGFAILTLVVSTVYIINDIMDVEADRQHPR
jgi:4-hydroxybenzoate polyprenyltransferase